MKSLEQDVKVLEMKVKGQETMWDLTCHLGHAQEDQCPMVSCWDPPRSLTSLSKPSSIQEHDIVIGQRPNNYFELKNS